VEEGTGYRLVDAGGQALYLTEEAVDGGLNIVDGECRLVDHVPFDRLQRASSNLASARL